MCLHAGALVSGRANGAAAPGGTVEGAAKLISKKCPFCAGIKFYIIDPHKGKFRKCGFLLLIISVRSGHIEFSPQGLKSLATSLRVCMYEHGLSFV